MAASVRFSEKCICGAMIDLSEMGGFVASHNLKEQYLIWREQHVACPKLFRQLAGEKSREMLPPGGSR